MTTMTHPQQQLSVKQYVMTEQFVYMGLPRPRPPPPCCSAFGFLMVSSTDRMRQAASDAAVSALILTTAGSHTYDFMLSAMSSLRMSTPNHVPPAIDSDSRMRRNKITLHLSRFWRQFRKYSFQLIWSEHETLVVIQAIVRTTPRYKASLQARSTS